ncbi:MAG: hypothetical protein AB1736_06470 [Chloroflexota bacterium]
MPARRLVAVAAAVGLTAMVAAVALGPRAGTATGVVVSVESTSLTTVTAFTIREADGRTRRFLVEALENAVEFPPGHLVEHIASGVPVVVSYREADGGAIAIRIVDGPTPGRTGAPIPT